MSLNRWVFKWCLNVETLSHSLMSAGKSFRWMVLQQRKRAERVRSVSGKHISKVYIESAKAFLSSNTVRLSFTAPAES